MDVGKEEVWQELSDLGEEGGASCIILVPGKAWENLSFSP